MSDNDELTGPQVDSMAPRSNDATTRFIPKPTGKRQHKDCR